MVTAHDVVVFGVLSLFVVGCIVGIIYFYRKPPSANGRRTNLTLLAGFGAAIFVGVFTGNGIAAALLGLIVGAIVWKVQAPKDQVVPAAEAQRAEARRAAEAAGFEVREPEHH